MKKQGTLNGKQETEVGKVNIMAATEVRDDQQLLLAIASGDTNAVDDFYHRHQARVYRYLLSKMNDSFAAADILNEVMFEVWRSAARFEGRAKVTTWLLGIAHHKVVDYWRKQGKREFIELDDDMVDETASVDQEQVLAAARDATLLRACLKKLSAQHSEILHLVFFEELDYGEIAGILQIPEGTVKSRVFHAKKLMKEQLAKAMRLS